MVIVLANLLRSKPGRAWVAIRDNDIAAEALGINIIWYKLLAFFVAGFMAGVAGAFWVCNTAALSPEHFQWFLVPLAGGGDSDRWGGPPFRGRSSGPSSWWWSWNFFRWPPFRWRIITRSS